MSLLQHKSGNASAGSVAVAFTSSPAVNSLLVATLVCDGSAVTPTISDTITNTWHLAVEKVTASGGSRLELWWAINTTNSADSITVGANGATVCVCSIFEYSGVVTVSPLDQTGSAEATGNISVTTTGAVAQADELVIAHAADWNNFCAWTAGAGYTIEETGDNSGGNFITATEDNNVTSGLSGVQTATMTKSPNAGTCGSLIATFKLVAAGGTQNYVNTGANNFVSQEIGSGIES